MWFWKAAYAYEVYLSLIQVFNISKAKYLQKLVLLCYGVPFIIVMMTASVSIGWVDYQQSHRLCSGYNLKDSYYFSNNICWLHGDILWWSFLTPVAILLIFNIIIFVIVFNELKKKQNSSYNGDISLVKHHYVLSVTMAISMGLTWIFAYLILISDNDLYQLFTSWLFAFTCSLQGLFIFSFSVARKRDVWIEVTKKLKLEQYICCLKSHSRERLPNFSSSQMSNNTYEMSLKRNQSSKTSSV